MVCVSNPLSQRNCIFTSSLACNYLVCPLLNLFMDRAFAEFKLNLVAIIYCLAKKEWSLAGIIWYQGSQIWGQGHRLKIKEEAETGMATSTGPFSGKQLCPFLHRSCSILPMVHQLHCVPACTHLLQHSHRHLHGPCLFPSLPIKKRAKVPVSTSGAHANNFFVNGRLSKPVRWSCPTQWRKR